MIGPINDYKLGKSTDNFINRLQEIFHFLPYTESAELLKKAWNSLIIGNVQASQRLNYLIESNHPISLISNTNELHIEKIKQNFELYDRKNTEKNEHWQNQTVGESHCQVYDNFKLLTAYDNGVFKTDGLLEKWVAQLVSEGHSRECITLVSHTQADLDKAKTLGISSKKPMSSFLYWRFQPPQPIFKYCIPRLLIIQLIAADKANRNYFVQKKLIQPTQSNPLTLKHHLC